MKNNISIKNILILVLVGTISAFFGCNKQDYPVPIASSQAKFTFQIDTLFQNDEVVGFEVRFTNQSINAKSYLWDFGNGDTSTEENPTYTYNEQGVYDVSLSITSDNELHYNRLVHSVNLRLLVKFTLLYEPFDGPDDGQDDTWLPEGWLAIDADGDGLNWYWASRQGNGQMRSQSWDGVPLSPDNWLITAEIDLTNVDANTNVWLNYNVCPTANTPMFRTEFYGVFVSTSGANPSDFQEIFSEALTEEMENWVYVLRELSLNSFKGEKIRIAFRHYQSSDKDRIVIDDVEVFLSEN